METAEEAKNRDWQDMMDEVYEYWNEDTKNRTRISSAEHFGPKHVIAVRLGNFNYQVGNGGTSQWIHNGYAEEDLDPLIEFFNKALVFETKLNNSVHINALNDIIKILSSFRAHANPNWSRWTIDCSYCDGTGTQEPEDEDDEEYKCFHCGGSGHEETKDYCETFQYFEFKDIEKNTILGKDDKSFYVWEESLFQELLDNFEEIEKCN